MLVNAGIRHRRAACFTAEDMAFSEHREIRYGNFCGFPPRKKQEQLGLSSEEKEFSAVWFFFTAVLIKLLTYTYKKDLLNN